MSQMMMMMIMMIMMMMIIIIIIIIIKEPTVFGRCVWLDWMVIEQQCTLTFSGPCIVIYSYNKTNQMH